MVDHGTRVAGIIGACTDNNLGIASVGANASLVSLKMTNTSSGFSVANVVAAVNYATQNNIPILNMSFAIGEYNSDLETAIQNYPGLVICAAGNIEGTFYPRAFGLSNVIAVGAIDSLNAIHLNTGTANVDLFAPGWNINSTLSPDVTNSPSHYSNCYGTSFSAPFVTGTAALMLARKPNLTTQQLKYFICSTVTAEATMTNACSTGGRLNIYNAVNTAVNHTHTAAVYTQYNATKHKCTCACGHTYYKNHRLQEHHIYSGDINEPMYLIEYICCDCGYNAGPYPLL